jgi:8-oxo-dGTP pyrophosphatase MutT (NUDIX family)
MPRVSFHPGFRSTSVQARLAPRMDPDELVRRLAALPHPPAEEGTRRAAVAIVLGGPALSDVLLLRRAERAGDRWSGQIGLPGGHADAGDADLAATARREAREEVGVDLSRDARLLGALAPVQAKARGTLLPMWITPFVFSATAELAPSPGPEAVETFWLPLARARAGELAWTHRYQREDEERVLPAWKFEERVVWGLTYEILGAFLRVVP